MQFRAQLNKISFIYRDWTSHGSPVGLLHGAVFRWAEGANFISEVLTPEQVIALQNCGQVTLEAVGDMDVDDDLAVPEAERSPAAPPPRPMSAAAWRKAKRRDAEQSRD